MPQAAAPRGAPAMAVGTRVVLHLEIRLPDGTAALSTWGQDPLVVTLGDGTLSPGLEAVLADLQVGGEERLLAHGDDLFGPRSPENVHWLPRADFPSGADPEPGQVVAFDTAGGQELAGVVLELDAQRVRVDLNHPLAGKTLDIRVQILAVEDAADASQAGAPLGQTQAPDLSCGS